jgi:hypothetical protein
VKTRTGSAKRESLRERSDDAGTRGVRGHRGRVWRDRGCRGGARCRRGQRGRTWCCRGHRKGCRCTGGTFGKRKNRNGWLNQWVREHGHLGIKRRNRGGEWEI